MGSGVPAKAECTGIGGWQLAVPVTGNRIYNVGCLYIIRNPLPGSPVVITQS